VCLLQLCCAPKIAFLVVVFSDEFYHIATRFAGHAPEPREGVESGHIPGSTNIPFTELLEADHRMKDIAELRRVFENAGIDMDKPVITSCGSGVTASVLVCRNTRFLALFS